MNRAGSEQSEGSCQNGIHISKPQGPGYNSNVEHLPSVLETLFRAFIARKSECVNPGL